MAGVQRSAFHLLLAIGTSSLWCVAADRLENHDSIQLATESHMLMNFSADEDTGLMQQALQTEWIQHWLARDGDAEKSLRKKEWMRELVSQRGNATFTDAERAEIEEESKSNCCGDSMCNGEYSVVLGRDQHKCCREVVSWHGCGCYAACILRPKCTSSACR
eukprot:gnl/TRDRNA2_/TRDRNA2_183670_c0_seq1.p1 gnl/TRDRNA2_/TRDRNA2_183670_c0~~gnl/TRDRNA2_/TRDRNA2_183670_c0_seq1.p1  ORF type:complete len:162 (-),score=17.61 gnl/TRDRNA2_/TRDRNA2_183670_c0_seq1:172-657(-)